MRKFVFIISMLMIAATSVAAKDFRGILPMHSTRADVEALLGPPSQATDGSSVNIGRSMYSLDDGELFINFVVKGFNEPHCLPTLPNGLVLMIRFAPKGTLPFTSLNLDVKQFKRIDANDPASQGYEGFVNELEGLAFRVLKGNVEYVVYGPTAEDRARCPAYYDKFEDFVRISLRPVCGGLVVKFDEFGDIRLSDEKARLDNFAIQLSNTKEAVGYIIVYAGQKAKYAEAELRGHRARQYLINIRHINHERLKAIDAGFREELTVELWILPAESQPPSLMPTVDPSQVEIVPAKKRRRN